jgi:V-type H+-transporting ATPase subunit D
MKTKLKGANTGHSLLKRKSEALTKRFREITRRIDTAKRKMGRVMQIASFSLAEVTYAAGDVGYHVQESVKTARFRVRARQENVRCSPFFLSVWILMLLKWRLFAYF